MNILICDDEQKYVDELKGHINEYMKEKAVNYTIYTALDPKEVISNDRVYQLAFLDIEMKYMNGIELAITLKKRNSKIVLFFITSFNDYLDDSMDVRAFRFFEKPVDVKRLYSGLDKAMEYIDETYIDFYLVSDGKRQQILMDDVYYVERVNRKVNLVTAKGTFTTKESFDHWAELLQNSFFYRVHKSFIVNFHYITRYEYTELYLLDNIRIPIASKRQKDCRAYWIKYVSQT